MILSLLVIVVILALFPRRWSSFRWPFLTGNVRPLYAVAASSSAPAIRVAGIRVRIEGREHVPAGRACIFMANHVSNLDAPALISHLPGRTSVFLKRSLMKIPILGYCLQAGRIHSGRPRRQRRKRAGRRCRKPARAGQGTAHHHIC